MTARKFQIDILYAGDNSPVDGIREHALRLTRELGHFGVDAKAHVGPDSQRALRELIRASVAAGRPNSSAVLLQYNALSYGRGGFAPGWALLLRSLRCRRGRPRIAVMVHEIETPLSGRILSNVWRKLQDRMVCSAADVLFTPIERYRETLAERHPRRPVRQLTVSSNLDIYSTEASRQSVRSSLGAEGLIVGTFGLGHNHLRLDQLVTSAGNAIAHAAERPVVLLNLGADAPPPKDLNSRVRVVSPGFLSERCISEHLGAVDIFLAPFADGVSARRTSFIAALQHGLPIVATDGPWTDDFLRAFRDAMLLVPSADRAGFASAAALLATDPGRRNELGQGAKALFENKFSWEVICTQLIDELTGQAEST